MIKDQMDKIYSNIPPAKIPWNMEKPPEILRNIVETVEVKPCRAIELGCGVGNYVIYLAHNGFNVTQGRLFVNEFNACGWYRTLSLRLPFRKG